VRATVNSLQWFNSECELSDFRVSWCSISSRVADFIPRTPRTALTQLSSYGR